MTPEGPFVDRFLDRVLDIFTAAPRPGQWQSVMTHLGPGQAWLDRHQARVAAGAARGAEVALAQAQEALAVAREHGIGLHVKDLEQMVRRLERSVT